MQLGGTSAFSRLPKMLAASRSRSCLRASRQWTRGARLLPARVLRRGLNTNRASLQGCVQRQVYTAYGAGAVGVAAVFAGISLYSYTAGKEEGPALETALCEPAQALPSGSLLTTRTTSPSTAATSTEQSNSSGEGAVRRLVRWSFVVCRGVTLAVLWVPVGLAYPFLR